MTLLGLVFSYATLSSSINANCSDIVLPLDDAFINPENTPQKMTRDLSLFMLKGLVNDQDAITNADNKWIIDCKALPSEVVEPLSKAIAVDNTIDPGSVQMVFERFYLKTIQHRKQDTWIKPTLLEMSQITNFKTWPKRVVKNSTIKRRSRRIYRSPSDFAITLHVSETLNTSGDKSPEVEVLETEVGILRESGDWDFYAYNKDGKLVNYSTFPAGQRPSPRICMNCHYDSESGKVNQFF